VKRVRRITVARIPGWRAVSPFFPALRDSQGKSDFAAENERLRLEKVQQLRGFQRQLPCAKQQGTKSAWQGTISGRQGTESIEQQSGTSKQFSSDLRGVNGKLPFRPPLFPNNFKLLNPSAIELSNKEPRVKRPITISIIKLLIQHQTIEFQPRPI
jgi:hypothetical protein